MKLSYAAAFIPRRKGRDCVNMRDSHFKVAVSLGTSSLWLDSQTLRQFDKTRLI